MIYNLIFLGCKTAEVKFPIKSFTCEEGRRRGLLPCLTHISWFCQQQKPNLFWFYVLNCITEEFFTSSCRKSVTHHNFQFHKMVQPLFNRHWNIWSDATGNLNFPCHTSELVPQKNPTLQSPPYATA